MNILSRAGGRLDISLPIGMFLSMHADKTSIDLQKYILIKFMLCLDSMVCFDI